MLIFLFAILTSVSALDAESIADLERDLVRIKQTSRIHAVHAIKEAFNLNGDPNLEESTIEDWRCYLLSKPGTPLNQKFNELESRMLNDILSMRKKVRGRDFIAETELDRIEKESLATFELSEKYGCGHRGKGPEILVRYLNIPYEIKRRRKAIRDANSGFWPFGTNLFSSQ